MEELEKALEEMGMANEAAAAEQEAAAPAPEPEAAAGNSCTGPAGILATLSSFFSAIPLSAGSRSGPVDNLATLCLWSPFLSLLYLAYSHPS